MSNWQSEYPAEGAWCWVTDGEHVWLAAHYRLSAGGWSNEDTWEDFDGAVTHCMPLEKPEPPREKA